MNKSIIALWRNSDDNIQISGISNNFQINMFGATDSAFAGLVSNRIARNVNSKIGHNVSLSDIGFLNDHISEYVPVEYLISQIGHNYE